MDDELPDIFEQLRPQPPAELRARVLAGVNRELQRRQKPRWERWLERSVAASFLLGVSLNVWQFRSSVNTPQSRSAAATQNVATAPKASAARSALGLGDARLDELVSRRVKHLGRTPKPIGAVTTASQRLLGEIAQPPAG